jgi:Spy/CpxP family protein refolding chaperone
MKKTFLSILLSATIISSGAFCANAQTPDMPEQPKIEHKMDFEKMHQKMQQKIAEDLGLSAEQQEQAKAIHEKGKAEIEPLMKEMKALRAKMDEKRRANMEEFEQILTPDQKVKFEELKTKAPHHGMHKDKGHKPPFAHHGAPFEGKAPAEFEVHDAN